MLRFIWVHGGGGDGGGGVEKLVKKVGWCVGFFKGEGQLQLCLREGAKSTTNSPKTRSSATRGTTEIAV